MKFASFLVLVFIPLFGCTEDNPGFVSDPQLPGECRAGEEIEEVFSRFEVANQIDILFVIDNSGDSGELQTLLSDAVPSFLAQFEGAGVNTQVAVATTDGTSTGLAEPGQLGEGCAGNDTSVAKSSENDRWKEIAACNVVLEITEDQPDVIFTTAQKLVTQTSLPIWRERARKLIIVVSRDDDCSATGELTDGMPREACADADNLTDVASFVEFIESQAQVVEGITIAFIAGPASENDGEDRVRPVCNSRIGPVYAGNRLEEVETALGSRAISKNVCSEDLTPALQSIASNALQKGTTICAGRPMAHEPLRVLGFVGGEESQVSIGTGGFVFLGEQPECENGALEFDAADLEEIEIKYCAL